jgi:cytochrome c
MDSFEWNKIAGAILFTLTFTLGLGIFAEIVFHRPAPERPGYELAGAPAEAAPAEAAAAATDVEPLPVRLAKASLDKGAETFKKCAGCHTIDKDGKNGIGPNLYNVMGGPKAHVEGFPYSDALKTAAADGGKWGVDELYQFIENPKGYLKGTKMQFQGLKDPQQRADLLAFIHSKSDAPITLPTP